MWFIAVCTLIDNDYALLLFSQTFFRTFRILREFAKDFERKVWREQVAHLHNVSSHVQYTQTDVFIDKDFFRYLWYCGKKTNRMLFSVALVKFHWFRINWHVLNKNCCFYITIHKIVPQAKSEKCCQIWFSPDLGGKMAAFWACACKLSWSLFSPARVQPL